jgi:PAS domain S-box-containing protein
MSRISPTDIMKMTFEDVWRSIHDLQVHQIELEMQNEELRNTQIELTESRDRYSDLYEFAPIGYVTLDKDGRILENNLAAAKMLGVERQALLRANISKYIGRESQDDWHLRWRAAISGETKQVFEIAMRRADGTPLLVHVETVVLGAEDDRSWRTALIDITDRKDAEAALNQLNRTLEERVQEQTAQIRLQAEAIAHVAEGVVISEGLDWSESNILFVNDALCRITGYTAGELIGLPRSVLHGRRMDRKTLNQIRDELSAGNSCRVELVQYRKDGTPYDADLSITLLPDVNGGRTTFVSIHRDITQARRLAQALRESEHRFRQMADQAPMMIWMSGADKLTTWFNKPWLEFTGRTMEQELGNGWAEGIHPDDLNRCLETYADAFDAREPFSMDYRLRRHNGEFRWVLNHGIPLYQDDGAFAGYIASGIDITDRKLSEDAQREREGLLQAILNTAADSIITTDRNGIIVAANPATERMFGYTRDELIGKNVKLLISPMYHDQQEDHIARYLTTGEARETIVLRKDGSTIPTELAVSEIAQLGLFTGIYRDISPRKRAEQEVDQYRKDLKTMASELMLAEERERRRLAEDLHDGLGQALFRARMKLDELSIADVRAKEVATILEEMGSMTNAMTFDLSPPVLRKLGLRPAIRSLARDMLKRYGLSVHVEDEGQDIPLEERVAVILFRSVRELLINVVKHAQTSRATLSLRKFDSSLQIEIEDWGKGFDPADQSRHIESGHFGLFSIRERLEYIGGTFKIRSALGQGTTVTMTTPLATVKMASNEAS